MSRPEWYYDDVRQLGTDFADAEQVAAYDRNQGRDPAEDRALAASLRIGPDQTLLDLGCGTGQFACEAAKLAREVVAIDVSPVMLEFARNRASNEKLGNLRFVHAGFLSYEHEGAPVDVAVSKFALHHLPDFWKAAALSRLHGWIRPGGLLFLRDVVFSFPDSDYRRGIEDWIARVASPAGKGFTASDFATHVREEHSTFRWILEGLIERAGFRIIACKSADEAYAEFRCLRI
ncbi:MAG TPA: methyltransferase domain-containing protein [Candidatus Udaeobacter sp.]|nr:methyltransferase domain-containing protein [Candidatus Udaeobacter sp.]